jgi:hypothetical protein
VAKKRQKKVAATDRDRIKPRRRSRLPVLVLTIITAIASLALLIAGFMNFSQPIH